jgi:hypothetical protein
MRPALLALLALTSCYASLRPHTAKHASETAAVCSVCRATDECGEELTFDTCESARQAACLDALANGRECPKEER